MLGAAAQPICSRPRLDRFVCELLTGPCKFYFDLEFPRTPGNAGIDGDKLQGQLLACMRQRLLTGEGFSQQQPWTPVHCTDVVVLDSSKAKKFSRQLS